MKISTQQLRQIIKEEMTNVTQANKKVAAKKPAKKIKDIIRPTGAEYVWDSEYFMDGDWPTVNDEGDDINEWLNTVPGLKGIPRERLEAEIEKHIGEAVGALGNEQAEYEDSEDYDNAPPMWRVTIVLHPTNNPKKPYDVIAHTSD